MGKFMEIALKKPPYFRISRIYFHFEIDNFFLLRDFNDQKVFQISQIYNLEMTMMNMFKSRNDSRIIIRMSSTYINKAVNDLPF